MPPDKAKILRDAEKYVLQGKIGSAISEYLKVVKTDPADVLTLNTIGDLCLRQGQVQEATKYFSQVAESYTKNNFLLKAIAVYKKILSADPDNIDMNGIVAALYAKQGLNVEARSQYLKVAELLAREGKVRESREAYEKVAELDPSNAAVQIKLGDIYLAEGSPERAHGYFLAAARAQTKTGNIKAAVDTYAATLDRNPLDVQGARGFLQAGIQLGDLSAVIRHLDRAVQLGADELQTRQMLGQAYLAANRLDEAGQAFESVLRLDEAQYENFFSVAKAFLDKGDYDGAVASIETILPILIERRETERGIDFILQILKTNPQHLASLQLLVRAYSAVNDVGRQTDTLERLVTHYLSRQKPGEALGYIEQILQLQPGSDRHLRMHRQTFQEAFPDTPYRAPAVSQRPTFAAPEPAFDSGAFGGEAHDSMDSRLVEIDLNLSYGARDKALSMLLQMEAQDPSDREVRKRLVTVYRENNQPAKAAEQCLQLAASFKAARNEEEAAKYVAEARSLAPELVGREFDERPRAAKAAAEESGGLEVDLTGDLSEIFFQENAAEGREEPEETPASPDAILQDIATQIPKRSGADIREQIQEVDFYVRLGFYDEARSKLKEIAAEFPDHPELAARFQKLNDAAPDGAAAASTIALGPGAEPSAEPPAAEPVVDAVESESPSFQVEPPGPPPTVAPPPAPPQPVSSPDSGVSRIFADLIDEVNALPDAQPSKETFETHFNLGTAYREMGLLDDSAREFQAAIASLNQAAFPREFVQCCGILSTCFVEKGMPRSAIRWCQSGLAVPNLSRHEEVALRYDLGMAYSLTGEPTRALESFEFVFRIDPGYRDVAARIDTLKGRS